MAYQRLAFGLLKLGAERHHFDAQTQRGKKDFAKSGVIAQASRIRSPLRSDQPRSSCAIARCTRR